MRKVVVFCVLAGLVLGQGKVRRKFYVKGTAGPGYVQQEFVQDLRGRLAQDVGPRRADRILARLRDERLSASDVMNLLNGEVPSVRLGRSESKALKQALKGAVADKERKLIFGTLLRGMLDGKEDPTSDFFGNVYGACEDIRDTKLYDQLVNGNVSDRFVRECFGLKDKDQRAVMRRYLNDAWGSPYLLHPMAGALMRRSGKGKGAQAGTYKPSLFPKVEEGMPGYGKAFEGGEAAGFAFDAKLPPVPFCGRENLAPLFK